MTSDRDRYGRALAGFRVGILVIDTLHDLVRGNVQHAGSFDFPVLYEIVRGVSAPALMSGDPGAASAIVAGARRLEAAGVQAIVGACGSFANYQSAIAGAVGVPVFMSILLEVPLLLRALPPSRRLGIVFASTLSFTDRVRHECGIPLTERIVAVGADALGAFQPIMRQSGTLDSPALASELVGLTAATMRKDPAIGAWLLQCSDLPPYAAAIRVETAVPVFDMISLINHVYAAIASGPHAH